MWLKKGHPALFLAPMEGVADYPMRTLLTKIPGFTHCVTEFLRVGPNSLPDRIFKKHALELQNGSRTSSNIPVIFQILGGDPQFMAETAAKAASNGALGIDINFGCPAPTVNRHDGGATLLRYPERIEKIVRAVRDAVPAPIPVSAKLRLGWDNLNDIQHNARRAESGGANWITIHGRTKMQGYTPPAYWEPIGLVQKQLSIPVVANGDIWDLKHFQRCREQTGCEHFMIGRSALANPFLAGLIAYELGLGPKLETLFPNSIQWKQLFLDFAQICTSVSDNPDYAISRIKQWMRYIKMRAPFPDFDKVKRIDNLGDLISTLENVEFPTSQLDNANQLVP